jgi:hypothetical protein
MKKIALFLMLIFPGMLSGQTSGNHVVTTADIETHTPTLDKVSDIINQFIVSHEIILIRQEKSFSKLYADFYLDKTGFDEFLNLVPSLGFLDHKKISSSASQKEEKSNQLELDYYHQQKKAYEDEIKNVPIGTERYNSVWDQIRYFEKQIYDTEKSILAAKEITAFRIQVSVIDETVDLSNKQVSWVNMPGAQYVFYMPEIPFSDISAKQYQGYALKYLFTRGKSFAELTTLKEFSNELNNEQRFSELFMLSFGQDFYSKYFGRGQNKFFNLYTGYNLGIIFATGTKSEQFNYFLSPTIGLELFKNKYFNVDTKTEYFVPFKENKNLRGLMFKASFNFVF